MNFKKLLIIPIILFTTQISHAENCKTPNPTSPNCDATPGCEFNSDQSSCRLCSNDDKKPDGNTSHYTNPGVSCAWTCNAGYFKDGTSCTACPPGKYKASAGDGPCNDCTSGNYCLGGTNSPKTCPKGWYCPGVPLPSSTDPCEHYKSGHMLLTDQDYTGRCACPGGHTTKTTGKSLRSDCMITPATKICDNTGKCFQIPSGATNIKSPITGGIWNP